MALTQTQAQLRTNVRRTGDWEGTSYTNRHSNTDVDDAVDRARGAFDRLLRETMPDVRVIAPFTITTAADVSVYALPSNFRSLLSVDVDANGHRQWIDAYSLPDRPALVDDNVNHDGIPYAYRLRAGAIELLPAPDAGHIVTLLYVTDSLQGNQALDTIERLDDFVIWYATRELAIKDAKWDLVKTMASQLAEIREEVRTIARSRDMNAPPKVIDTRRVDRYGRFC